MKYLLVVFCFFSFGIANGQEVKAKQESSLPGKTAYIVDGKFMKESDLSKITSELIESVDVIKRDTLINETKYESQLFVRLKKKIDSSLLKED